MAWSMNYEANTNLYKFNWVWHRSTADMLSFTSYFSLNTFLPNTIHNFKDCIRFPGRIKYQSFKRASNVSEGISRNAHHLCAKRNYTEQEKHTHTHTHLVDASVKAHANCPDLFTVGSVLFGLFCCNKFVFLCHQRNVPFPPMSRWTIERMKWNEKLSNV